MSKSLLSVFLDRKLRHSKSTSNLTYNVEPGFDYSQDSLQQPKKPGLRDTSTVIHDCNSGRRPSQSPALPISYQPPQLRAQSRSSAALMLYPPDELFLSNVRRRSASARLEEMRINTEQYQKHDPDLDLRLAFASALPPTYLDSPPAYQSPEAEVQNVLPVQFPRDTSVMQHDTIVEIRKDELSLDNTLQLQIDETIAQFSSIKLTTPTPLVSSAEPSSLVSPINEIDHIYLEQRRRRKKQERARRAR